MKDSKILLKMEFVSFCIEQYKMLSSQSGCTVEQMFEQNGVSQFLIDHYEVLHTQSAQYIIDEINLFLKNHKR